MQPIKLTAFTQFVSAGEYTEIPLVLLEEGLDRLNILNGQIGDPFVLGAIEEQLDVRIDAHDVGSDAIDVGVDNQVVAPVLIVDSLQVGFELREL